MLQKWHDGCVFYKCPLVEQIEELDVGVSRGMRYSIHYWYHNGKVYVYVIIYLMNLHTRKTIASLCSNYQRDIKRVEPFCVPRIKRSCGVKKYCRSVRQISTIYKYVTIYLYRIYILGSKQNRQFNRARAHLRCCRRAQHALRIGLIH